jgi:hypothetical protein
MWTAASIWRLRVGETGRATDDPDMISSGCLSPDFVGLLTSRPSVGPGGRQFAYKSMEVRSNCDDRAIGPASGMGLRPLTAGTAAHPIARISNDGSRIAVVRSEGQARSSA